MPTEPGKKFGYIIEYNVQDLSNNAAPTARRLITIICPGKEKYCIDPDTSKPACTTDGQCGKPAALGGGTVTAPAKAVKPPEPPSISLAVSGTVEVPAGTLYDRCSADAPMTVLCERGATAEDARDGVLDSQVMVCGNRSAVYNLQRLHMASQDCAHCMTAETAVLPSITSETVRLYPHVTCTSQVAHATRCMQIIMCIAGGSHWAIPRPCQYSWPATSRVTSQALTTSPLQSPTQQACLPL